MSREEWRLIRGPHMSCHVGWWSPGEENEPAVALADRAEPARRSSVRQAASRPRWASRQKGCIKNGGDDERVLTCSRKIKPACATAWSCWTSPVWTDELAWRPVGGGHANLKACTRSGGSIPPDGCRFAAGSRSHAVHEPRPERRSVCRFATAIARRRDGLHDRGGAPFPGRYRDLPPETRSQVRRCTLIADEKISAPSETDKRVIYQKQAKAGRCPSLRRHLSCGRRMFWASAIRLAWTGIPVSRTMSSMICPSEPSSSSVNATDEG
ncbi:Hypothetical protein NGAL_HAMBI2427_62080 [Neorhizobium galegae bv. orientalis]|nr:Hypothetical protein NGAL_HAMBI2427_62080 [Neorhizobium galegae bv. orientalis]